MFMNDIITVAMIFNIYIYISNVYVYIYMFYCTNKYTYTINSTLLLGGSSHEYVVKKALLVGW